MDKNILKQLKTDYENLEIKPSVNLWNQIEGRIEGTEKEAKKQLFHWWKYAAVIAFLISVGGLFYFNSNQLSKLKETSVAQKPLENDFKPTEIIENIAPNESLVQNPVSYELKIKKTDLNVVSEKLNEKIENLKNLEIIRQEIKTNETPILSVEKLDAPLIKTIVAEKKKGSYISADDLLIGRELDKTREENNKDQRKFGVFDISKIKGPSSLKIFGFSVISDSLDSK